MKTLTFYLVIILPLFAIAQPKEAIVNLGNRSATQMYNTAKEWFALSSNPGNVSIQVDDPVEQKLIGKGVKNMIYTIQKSPTFIDVNYALSVQFKEGRFKYHLDVNSIKYEDGYEMSFEDFKSLTTKEGWNAYRKKPGVRPQFSNKVDEATMIDIYTLMNKNFDKIIADLTSQLESEKNEVNW
jgi:hypothetical protein